MMSEWYQALTEKEKETLRLIVRGHDAKSMARHLGLSVHTINERLRDARRKMTVSSSREAARLLFDREHEPPHSLADIALRDAGGGTPGAQGDQRPRHWSPAWIAGGVLAMSLFLAALALALSPVAETQSPVTSRPVLAPAVPETEVVQSARSWLALVDAHDWDERWRETGSAFRALNTAATWSSLSEQVRTPLGAATERTLASQEELPAPPRGYQVVKFRTSFAAKPDTMETVTLERDGKAWRVVGYIIG
jgi:DNA-binding CsgD family transcriptional regulator